MFHHLYFHWSNSATSQECQEKQTLWWFLKIMKRKSKLPKNAIKWASMSSINKLKYRKYKNIMKCYSKHYSLKANLKKQGFIIKNRLKIQIFENHASLIQIYLIVVKNWEKKDELLKEKKILLNAIKENRTQIKARPKIFAYIATKMSNYKS